MKDCSTSQKMALGLLAFCLLALLVGVFNALSGGGSSPEALSQSSDQDDFSNLLATGGLKRDHLLLVDVSGMIVEQAPEGGLFSAESMAVSAKKALEHALKDDSIKGVLIRVNSPGGTVGMSQELNQAVRRLVEARPNYTPKPVVVSMGDVAASGGYYLSCAADKIVANPGTLTASIGVIISTLNMKGLLVDKLGLKSVTIKSGKYKDILSPYRDPSAAELDLIQTMINSSYQQFLRAVIEGRTRFISNAQQKQALAEKIKSVADGRILIGTEAQKMGLVDELGDMVTARKLLDTLAKERFHLRGKEDLPLEEATSGFNLKEFLGIESRSPNHSLESMLPFSMAHPNQPLWVME